MTAGVRMEQATGEGGSVIDWMTRHQRALAIGAGSIVVLVLVIWFAVASGKRKEAFALQALEGARVAMDAGNLPLAQNELQRVIDTYRGTDAALHATLSLNVVRMQSNQHELASQDLQALLDRVSSGPIAAQAAELLGIALENQGKFSEAADAFQRSSQLSSLTFEKADALLSVARARATAGDTAAAVAALERILGDYPESAAVTEAKIRLGELSPIR